MHRRRPVLGRQDALAFLILSLILPNHASAVDDEAAFVEALRQRGEHALVIEYLDGAAERGLTSDAFRSRLPYERLVTRLDQVRTIRGFDQRRAALSDASSSLDQFAAASDVRQLAAEGQTRLAEVLASLAAGEVAAAQPITDEGSPRLVWARDALQQARRRYSAAEETYRAEIERYKGVPSDSPEGEQRLRLREQLLKNRLLGIRTLQQEAQAYNPEGGEAGRRYAEAVDAFADYYEKNSRLLFGLYAHLYQGQCHLALGETKLAAGCFEALAQQPDEEPAFRRLVTLAQASLVETRLADDMADLALRGGEAWYEGLSTDEQRGPGALALAYQLATAAELLAKQDGADQRRLLGQARRLFRVASRSPNEFRDRSRDGLNRVNEALGAADTPLGSFAEAYQAVRDAVGSLAASKQAVKLAERNNPAVVQELKDDVGDYRRRALMAINAALTLVEDETSSVQLNEVRSNQAFLLWESGDYLRAAVVGDFLTTNYPSDPSAEQAASLALASLQRMYQDAREQGEDARFEIARLRRLTAAVTRSLPGTRAASGAASVLVSILLNEGRVDDARQALELVPEAGRVSLELQLANSLWERSVRELAEAGPDDQDAVQQRKAQAAEQIAAAVKKAAEARPVSAAMATAKLFLAQAKLESEGAEAALNVLTEPDDGPLALLAAKARATKRTGYATEVYKLAMRSYLTVDPPRTIEALRTMKRLEEAVAADGGDSAEQRAKLTRIYFNVGVQLQRQMTDLTARGKEEQASQIGSAVAAFLDSLNQQSSGADWTTLQWIGQTYLQLADGLTAEDSKTAADYRSRARDAFRSMIDRASEDAAFAPKENSLLAVRLQLGRALSKLDEHQQALDTFCEVLRQRGSLIEVQKAAAYALQRWGERSDPAKLQDAIRGERPDPRTRKNLVWGWSRLSRVAAQASRRRPEYKDLFFESWVNIVACRVIAAERAEGSKREKQLASAKRSLAGMARQYKDLGGPERRGQFDRLARRVQRLERQEPTGIKAFEK